MAKQPRWIQIHEDLCDESDRTASSVATLACKRIADQETDLREMRRRAEVAESLLETTVEDCRREGVSMGRALANAAATKARARVDELESRHARLVAHVREIERRLRLCPLDDAGSDLTYLAGAVQDAVEALGGDRG